MHDLLTQLRRTLREHRMLDGVQRIGIGFSGGVDSTSLLLALRESVGAIELEAVHMHHHLRGAEADADAAWCEQIASRFDLPFQRVDLPVTEARERSESTEMAARRLRLAWWRQWCAAAPGRVVALGHHRDDVLETLLLRMLRGANASGLTGLRHRREVNSVRIIRPLLDVDREHLERWLGATHEELYRGIRRDTSNADLSIARNAVRHRLVPLLRQLGDGLQGLHHTLAWLREDAELLEGLTRDAGAALDVAMLRELPSALWPRILRAWCAGQGLGDSPVPGHLLRQLRDAFAAEEPDTSLRLDFDAEYFLRLERGTLALEPRQAPSLRQPVEWAWDQQPRLALPSLGVTLVAEYVASMPAEPGEPCRSWWPAAALPSPLIIRQRQPGDRLLPFGASAPVRVKKLLGHAKVTKETKDHLVVVCRPDGEILWIPGVRRSAHAVVDATATAVVELRYDFNL